MMLSWREVYMSICCVDVILPAIKDWEKDS